MNLITTKKQQGKSEGFDSCYQRSDLTQIRIKSSIFGAIWSWNLMDDLEKQYGTSSSFVQHFKAIGEFKQKLQSGNAPIQVKIGDFLSCVTLKFDGWPLKKNRAPLLYYIKLCASFQSHGWIQTGVTVRKHSNRVKISNFFVPYDLEIWRMTLKKQ